MKLGYTTLDFLSDCETLIEEAWDKLTPQEHCLLQAFHGDVEDAGHFTLTDNEWAMFRKICEKYQLQDVNYLN